MPHRTYEKPSDQELRQKLSPLAYEVTQNEATEPPFNNRYWNQHEPGLYVDVASGEPLFSSRDKFDSGTGWPSFTRPVATDHVVERVDRSLGIERTEVRSRAGQITPGSCLLRRASADGSPLLHQLRRASLRSRRATRGGGV